jgi:Zn-finger nucleic acid-binding protein
MDLLCPKCRVPMEQREHNGLVVDQCTECRGLFLDHGELEKLVRAENGWYVGDDRRPASPPRYESRYDRRPQPRYEPRYEERHRYGADRPPPGRRRSFLEQLFDGVPL